LQDRNSIYHAWRHLLPEKEDFSVHSLEIVDEAVAFRQCSRFAVASSLGDFASQVDIVLSKFHERCKR